MFSVMWSEHCSYKSSRRCCRAADRPARTWSPVRARTPAWSPSARGWRSPSSSSRTTTRARSSRTRAPRPAWAASCATSSPWAPGPIAILDALKFGDPADARTRRLVDGVVRGVGGYGNCVGVPTVGGELVFDPSYTDNPLVNVMAVGLLEERLPDAGGGARPGQPRRALRLGDRPRRDRRRVASSPAPRSTTARPSGRRSRSATRSPRSCSSRPAWSSSSAASSRASRTWARRASRVRPPRRPTGPGPASRVDLDAVPRREPAWRRSRS